MPAPVRAVPRSKPLLGECAFYTCMDFPDGESIENVNWDIRGRFPEYIGGVDVAGKSVLDVGTASGFLAFEAERAGAARTVALDAFHAREFNRIPFAGTPYNAARHQWVYNTNAHLEHLKNSFWYAWHKHQSNIEVFYGPALDLWEWNERFDIVIAGAIVEHVSDPIPFISNLANLSNDIVVIAFTQVAPDEELLIRPILDWENPQLNYSWWSISFGLYKKMFANLGFSVELVLAKALCNEYSPPILVDRPTIVARRIR